MPPRPCSRITAGRRPGFFGKKRSTPTCFWPQAMVGEAGGAAAVAGAAWPSRSRQARPTVGVVWRIKEPRYVVAVPALRREGTPQRPRRPLTLSQRIVEFVKIGERVRGWAGGRGGHNRTMKSLCLLPRERP